MISTVRRRVEHEIKLTKIYSLEGVGRSKRKKNVWMKLIFLSSSVRHPFDQHHPTSSSSLSLMKGATTSAGGEEDAMEQVLYWG